MAQGQGIYKQIIVKKQVSRGTAASGSGGFLLRRETANFKLAKDTFTANEITSHQQSTGDTYGVGKADGTVAGVLSPSTYNFAIENVLRAAAVATSAIASLTLTIAADGDNWSVTRSTGDFLSGGIKIGDVVRLAGANLDPANVGINLLVLGVTATVLTVAVLNGDALTAESAKASSTVSVPGKKVKAPLTGHTNDYFTIESWHADIARSLVYRDMQAGKIDIGLPSTGNATISIPFMGLDEAKSGSQVLTSPTAETTTPILTAVNGYLIIGTSRVVIATSASISIDGGVAFGEATIGSKRIGDLVKGDIKVTGSFTALYEDETIGSYFDDETPVPLIFVVTDSAAPASDFITFSIPKAKVLTKEADDGKKQLIRSHNFSAEINGAGGPALASDKTIITVQDSTLS
jgi:hypothetical protein